MGWIMPNFVRGKGKEIEKTPDIIQPISLLASHNYYHTKAKNNSSLIRNGIFTNI